MALVAPWNGVAVRGLQPVDAALALAMALTGIDLLTRNVSVPRPMRWMSVGAAGIALTTLIHTCLAGSGTELEAGAKWLASAFVFPMMSLLASRGSPELPRHLAAAWTLGVATSAAVAVSDFYGLSRVNERLVGYVNSSGRQGGLTSQPNNVGLACAMALPFVILLYQRHRAWLLAGVVLLGGEIASGSRAGQVAFVVAFAATLVGVVGVTPRGRRSAVKACMAVTGAVAITWSQRSVRDQAIPFLRVFASGESVDLSNSGRIGLARGALETFASSPFVGNGFEQLKHGHSVPLQLAATGGVLLITSFTFYSFGAIVRPLRFWSEQSSLTRAAIIGHSCWLAAGTISNAISDRYLYIPITIVAVTYTSPFFRRQDRDIIVNRESRLTP